MNQDTRITPRRMSLALLLSLGATGLGQIYCGRLRKGLILFMAGLALIPAFGLAARAASGTALSVLLVVFVLGYVGLFVYALVDAGLMARRASKAYALNPCNSWYLYAALIAVSLLLTTGSAQFVRDHVVEPFRIPSASMAPSILPGDFVLLDRDAFDQGPARRGDLVVFRNPNNRSMFMLKRIIALPGDTIEVRDGRASVNGRALSEAGQADRVDILDVTPAIQGFALLEQSDGVSYQVMVPEAGEQGHDLPLMTVPNGHCFVLGDNRPQSMDSREFGPVPLADLRGRVESIYITASSWSRFGAIE